MRVSQPQVWGFISNTAPSKHTQYPECVWCRIPCASLNTILDPPLPYILPVDINVRNKNMVYLTILNTYNSIRVRLERVAPRLTHARAVIGLTTTLLMLVYQG